MEMVEIRMTVTGRLQMEACLSFMDHYLQRLDLKSRICHAGTDRVEIDLHGHEALIDMFEIACWLGPADSYIDKISTSPL